MNDDDDDHRTATDSSNRLHLSDDGETAECDIIGIWPFSTLIPWSYEVALAMELAIRHLNTGKDSIVSDLSGLPQRCPIKFNTSFASTSRYPRDNFAIIDSLTRHRSAFARLKHNLDYEIGRAHV